MGNIKTFIDKVHPRFIFLSNTIGSKNDLSKSNPIDNLQYALHKVRMHVKCSGLRARRENRELSLRTPQRKQLLIHAAEECHTWQASWLRKPVLNPIATGLSLKAKNAHEQHLPTCFTWENIFYAAKKCRLQIQRYFEWNHVCHLKRF